ncbi:hypothetical protein AB4113_00795 [Vibrio breoganii]
MNTRKLLILMSIIALSACENSPRLGTSVDLVKNEQVYNPNATEENQSVVAPGSGERSQVAVKGYNSNK